MTHSPMSSLSEFHDAFGQKRFIEMANDQEREDALELRMRLITEEFEEVATELGYECHILPLSRRVERRDIHHLAKELADLLYVVYGTAEIMEIPLEDVFAQVHANNMTKLGPDGKPLYREDGKFLKPEGYQALDPLTLF